LIQAVVIVEYFRLRYLSLTPSSSEVKECVELYLHSSNTTSWRGAWLSTGTTLPLLYKNRFECQWYECDGEI